MGGWVEWVGEWNGWVNGMGGWVEWVGEWNGWVNGMGGKADGRIGG